MFLPFDEYARWGIAVVPALDILLAPNILLL